MPGQFTRINVGFALNLFHQKQSNQTKGSDMKKILLLGILVVLSPLIALSQDQSRTGQTAPALPERIPLRPNSRDYTIIRKGNNHQRIVQMRNKTMIRNRQAMLNRKMAMEHRREITQQRMFRQQQIRQRMIRQRGMHR